jgi:hypothetical protein
MISESVYKKIYKNKYIPLDGINKEEVRKGDARAIISRLRLRLSVRCVRA